MGLWTVAPERLQSPACSLYKVPLQLIEQSAKGTISVIQKPLNTLGGFVPNLKPGLNVAENSTNENIELKKSNKQDSQQKETQGGLLSKVPIPRIPFAY